MIVCDRCRQVLPKADRTEIWTIGFYDTTSHDWARFANPGETVVCDACMWADPRYIAVYGHVNRGET